MESYFIILFIPGAAWHEGKSVFEQPLDDHVDFIYELYKRGVVVMAGPFADGTGGLTILKAQDEDEARRLMDQDPDVIRQILSYDARPWLPIDWEAYGRKKRDSAT